MTYVEEMDEVEFCPVVSDQDHWTCNIVCQPIHKLLKTSCGPNGENGLPISENDEINQQLFIQYLIQSDKMSMEPNLTSSPRLLMLRLLTSEALVSKGL